jgi:hypothetical protein
METSLQYHQRTSTALRSLRIIQPSILPANQHQVIVTSLFDNLTVLHTTFNKVLVSPALCTLELEAYTIMSACLARFAKRWVTKMAVFPLLFSWNRWNMSRSTIGSKAEVGSSTIRSLVSLLSSFINERELLEQSFRTSSYPENNRTPNVRNKSLFFSM